MAPLLSGLLLTAAYGLTLVIVTPLAWHHALVLAAAAAFVTLGTLYALWKRRSRRE